MTNERTELEVHVRDKDGNHKLITDHIYVWSEALGTDFTIQVNQYPEDHDWHPAGVELLIVSNTDPNFDTSKIVCLTADGATTAMLDTRPGKGKRWASCGGCSRLFDRESGAEMEVLKLHRCEWSDEQIDSEIERAKEWNGR